LLEDDNPAPDRYSSRERFNDDDEPFNRLPFSLATSRVVE